jgi:MFS family permease
VSNPNKVTVKGLTVWIVCAIFYMYEFLLRTVLGTFQLPLSTDLSLTPVEFALLSSTAYQLVYGFMQIPVGIVTDSVGLKKALFIAVLTCTTAAIGFALSHTFMTAILFRILMGFGSSFGFVCLLIAVYDWLPRKNIALFIGLSQFIGTIGPMAAAGPLNMLSEASIVGWRSVFLSLSIVGFIIAFLVFLVVDKNRQTTGKFTILSRPTSVFENLKRLISNKQIWMIAGFCAFSYFTIEYLSENDGVSFLIRKGFTPSFSSYMITLAWVGFAIGCPLSGLVSDKVERRKPIIIVSAALTLIALLVIFYCPVGQLLTSICFVLLGFGIGGHSVGIALIAEQCKKSYLALGLGLNNALTMTFTALASPFIGNIVSKYPHPTQLVTYQKVFVIIVLLAILALLLSIFCIKETFAKNMKENTSLLPSSY